MARRIYIPLLLLGLLLCSCKTSKKAEKIERTDTMNEVIQDSSRTDIASLIERLDTSNLVVTITKTEYDTDKADSIEVTISDGKTVGSLLAGSSVVSSMLTDSTASVWSHPVKSVTTVTLNKRNGIVTTEKKDETRTTGSTTKIDSVSTKKSEVTEEKSSPVAEGTHDLMNWIGGASLVLVILAFLLSVAYIYREYKKNK